MGYNAVLSNESQLTLRRNMCENLKSYSCYAFISNSTDVHTGTFLAL
jgi:hypothetical protein